MENRAQSIKKLIASHMAKETVTSFEATEEILRDQPSDFADTMTHELITKVRAAWDYDHIEADKNRLNALERLSHKVHSALIRLKEMPPLVPISSVDYTAFESVIVTRLSSFLELTF